ncbi:MAG TPA: lysophospholipid acyltransferase family protein [Clostridia bacterium]|nr:lysophospholipid acyltransferase family protein [Clostridia bacterium]
MRPTTTAATFPVRVSQPLVTWFLWYAQRYVARHFHSLRVSRATAPPVNRTGPLVIYVNHASWWDPMTCALIARTYFRDRLSFTPIDAAALEKYKFFKRLGFFPVDQKHRRGAAQFLRTAEAVLQDSSHVLWLTPQGRFADVRERPLGFRAGLGHLPRLVERATFVPLAVEYAFWEEKSPEILVRFGDPISVTRAHADSLDAKGWTAVFERQMQATQEALADQVLRRDTAEFDSVLHGTAGVGGIYDAWRRFRAALHGQRINLEHGTR